MKSTLLAVAVAVCLIPTASLFGCNKYSAQTGTYYFKSGTCATSTDYPYNSISISIKEGNIVGAYDIEECWVKIEKNRLTVNGEFSPEVSGLNAQFRLSTAKSLIYDNISFSSRAWDEHYYDIICDGEKTGWKVSATGNGAVYEYGYSVGKTEGTHFSYQLIYEK